MNSKEKAIELVKKFTNYFGKDSDEVNDFKAKQCALIAVEEIIKTLNEDIQDLNVVGNVLLDLIKFWKEVKQEIENL